MSFLKIRLLLILFLYSILSFGQTKSPKYVFLFIGDGMGSNQIKATELYLSNYNSSDKKALSFINFPTKSWMTTFSANSDITCSSAAATAMSSGYKTNNGFLNISPNEDTLYQTLSVKAKKAGYKVGILSSVSLDHATPAGFYAHQKSRNNYYEISMELPNYAIDYFGGGGFQYPNGKSGNQSNAYENAVSKGYIYCHSITDFNALKPKTKKVLAVNPKLYPKGEFYWAIDKVDSSISLAEFTKKGIELLDNSKGFFMMVEGGKIDWACHSNDAISMIYEVIEFNKAIEQALKFYKKHPNETLIIVTADHETGGLSFSNQFEENCGLLKNQVISIQEFKHKIDELKLNNPSINFNKIMSMVTLDFGLGDSLKGLSLSPSDSAEFYASYRFEFGTKTVYNSDENYLSKHENSSIADCAVKILNRKAGISWGSGNHSAADVPLKAIGVGSEHFQKTIDNTDLPKIIGKLMGF